MIKENKLEIIFKGVANKNRIKILLFLEKHPESSVGDMAEIIKLNFRTASDHVTKMMMAGLVMKRHDSINVRLALTERGKKLARFLRNLD